MSQNESAGIEILKGILRHKASETGGHFEAYPLGGQDRHVLADDIFAAADYFTIVESKWSEDQLPSEATSKTDRVRRLCEGLARNSEMAVLHAKCHRIAWRDSTTEMSMLQPYRDAICADSFPGTCVALATASPLDADVFASEFFGIPPRHCVPMAEFVKYVKWLRETVTGTRDKSVVVLARAKSLQGKSISKEITLESLAAQLRRSAATTANSGIKRPEKKAMNKPRRPGR